VQANLGFCMVAQTVTSPREIASDCRATPKRYRSNATLIVTIISTSSIRRPAQATAFLIEKDITTAPYIHPIYGELLPNSNLR
jgi:hypothetical protein